MPMKIRQRSHHMHIDSNFVEDPRPQLLVPSPCSMASAVISTGGCVRINSAASAVAGPVVLFEGLLEEVVEAFGGSVEEGVVLKVIVKLIKWVSVGAPVRVTVLLPLAIPGCILVVVLVVMLGPRRRNCLYRPCFCHRRRSTFVFRSTILHTLSESARVSPEAKGSSRFLSGWYLRASHR